MVILCLYLDLYYPNYISRQTLLPKFLQHLFYLDYFDTHYFDFPVKVSLPLLVYFSHVFPNFPDIFSNYL